MMVGINIMSLIRHLKIDLKYIYTSSLPYNMTETTSTQKITLITDETTPYCGVYSFEQEKHRGKFGHLNGNSDSRCARYNIYEKEDGTQVNVTEVSRNPNLPTDHKSRFDDSIFVGNVVKWVSTVLW